MPPPGGLMNSCGRPGVRSRRKTTKVSVFSPTLSLSLTLSVFRILCGALWGKQSRHRTDLELEFRISERVEIAE